MTFKKLSVIATLLFFLDIALRVFLETYILNEWKLSFLPRRQILGWIPYLALVIGWTYLAVVVAFHFLKRRVKSKNWIFNGFLGWILFTVAFLFYWLDDYGTSYGTNNLLEGLIVYLVLGFVMNILYDLPMWESKQGNT